MDVDQLAEVIETFVQDHGAGSEQLLPVLHHITHSCGCVPNQAVNVIATALNISAAEVVGVVSFYEDFHTEPVNTSIDVCCAEACQSVGARKLYRDLSAELEPDDVAVRVVYCLGNCAAAPSVRFGDHIIGLADVADVKKLIRVD